MKRSFLWIYPVTMLAFFLITGWGSRAVTALAEHQTIQRSHCLVIDAGHGGVDGGAVSCTGRSESSYNLEISLVLRDFFHILGYDTKMIRTEDISVYTEGDTIARKKISDLKNRVRMVHDVANPFLLSIHQNQFSDSRYHGAQVFFAKTPGSEVVAKELQSNFTKIDPQNKRKIKKASGVYLMDHISCPGLLIECGFLSNAIEEAKLRDPGYQKKLAVAIASTLATNLSNA